MQNMILLLAENVPEGRVFGLDSQTLIQIGIQLLNGIFLAVVLAYILYNPVKEFLRKRTERIQGKIANADATMAKAKGLIVEYDEKIQEIDKERVEILENARSRASDETKSILQGAQEEAEVIKKRSLEGVAEDKKRLQEETRLYIIELASIMAEKYITENIDTKAQDKIFKETLAQLEDTQWQS